ncbi:MAG: AMP-binding protein [Bdellovibrionales bacterium]|nr:AMP-binding protein [Bdellovibrionales bacterium]
MEKFWVKNYDKGVAPEIDLSEYDSLGQVIQEVFDKYSDKPAFHNMGTTLSYDQIRIASLKFASYLQNDLGLQKGDRVALMMPNILQYPICLFGILQAGMVAVNVNPLYTARELEHQLNDSESSTIVIFDNSAHILESIVSNTKIKNIITTEIGDLLNFPKSLIVNFVLKHVKKMVPKYSLGNAISIKDILAEGDISSFKAPQVSKEDIAFLQYTGGTTGVSKGAILTHSNIISNLLQARTWISNLIRKGEEIIITPLPLYHIFSLTANCLAFSSVGALNILITNPRDLPGFIKELKKWKFTAFTGVNTLFNGLINNPEFKNVDFSKLRLTLGGGMAVQQSVAEKWKEVTGAPLIEAYGLTETSPAACMNPMTLEAFNGTVGLPISSTEVAIRGDDSEDNLPIGEVGEICIKGPQVMQGYWNRPEETDKVMDSDDFFRSGDIGFMDESGYVKIVDRKKDMILVSGFNVFPNEIEDVISTHPKVFESAAVGVKDQKSGEVVKIFIVKKDQDLTEDELRAHCKENLTGYKCPRYYEFRDELPKSNVGKILRKELRE